MTHLDIICRHVRDTSFKKENEIASLFSLVLSYSRTVRGEMDRDSREDEIIFSLK